MRWSDETCLNPPATPSLDETMGNTERHSIVLAMGCVPAYTDEIRQHGGQHINGMYSVNAVDVHTNVPGLRSINGAILHPVSIW